MVTGIVYDDIYLEHRIGTHVESHVRLVAIMKLLKEKGILDNTDFELIKPRKATLNQIKYVHTENLINEVKELCELSQKTGRIQQLDMDTAVSAKTFEVSLFSVGGNLECIDAILSEKIHNGFALVRPPGHHSNSYRCAGFCIFNNIAIATEYLLREKGFKRVAIIDWDCHHGNGTQDIFFNGTESGEVIIINSHQDPTYFYPGSGFFNEIGADKGAGKIINFPMPPNSADDAIMIYFDEIVSPILNEFKPEFILISAGFDTHWTDRLTSMGWTYQAPARYLEKIKKIAEMYSKGRIMLTLEGGYEVDKQAIAVYNCLQVLNDRTNNLIEEKPRHSEDDILNYINSSLFPKLKNKLKIYWNCFQ
jgi:acetoin utilization deacetylase AcuC-like enzyme